MKTKIYLLPGIMCDSRLWSKLREYFNDSYELIHLDIPLANSFDEIVDLLNEKIEDESINLLGFSLGGYVASYFALKYKHRVKKLLLIGSSPCDLPSSEITKREELIEFTKSYGIKGLARKKVQSLLDKSNENNDEIITLIQDMFKDLGKDIYLSQLSSTLRRGDLSDKLLKLNIPLTFYYALEDRLVNIKWMDNMAKNSKSIKFIKIEGTSHMIPLEKAEHMSEVIKETFF